MSAEVTEVWAECVKELEKDASVSAVSLDVFIRTLTPLMYRDSSLVLLCKTASNKAVVMKNYVGKITAALQAHYPTLSAIVIDESERDDYVNAVEPIAAPDLPPPPITTKLQPKYTFDTFVVGKNNQFVHAAARAVVENPGSSYNPLFIYGNVGLGKTHIMQAIGNAILQRRPDYNIMYVTCENFMNEFIESIRQAKDKNSAQSFRNRYRSCDMLLIDDIQFIANKTGTQEELFHTFNDLHASGKQLIFTSDRPPKEINPLEERLRSRFAGGLIADIQPPDLETRIAILQKKSLAQNYRIPNDVLEYIAEQNDDNVRTMEADLTRAYFYASLNDQPLTVELAKLALAESNPERKEHMSMDTIINVVCKYYSVSRDDLLGKKKTKDIAYQRQMCIYLITEIMSVPLATIGQLFGGRDHTTIMHSRDKISQELKNNPSIKMALQDLRNMIYKK